MARMAPLLDGNNGTLSMTLGLGDPVSSTYLMGESALILGRQMKEPSLYVNAGTRSQSAPFELPSNGFPDSPGGGGGGDGDGGGGDSGDGGGGDGGDAP